MANVALRSTCKRFFGVFHTPPSGNYTLLWTSFDFETDWKPQIDACRALGANLFVYFGSAIAGHADISAYIANRRIVADYLEDVGMYGLSYALGGTLSQWIGTITGAHALAVLQEDVPVMASYKSQIGYVILDEPWGSSPGFSDGDIVSYCADLYAVAKAAAPADFGITTGVNPCGNIADVFSYSVATATRCDSLAPYSDFFAFHPFKTIALSDSSAVRAAYPGKEIMMPSTVSMNNGNAAIPACVASIMDLVGSNGFRGMAYFICLDYDASTLGLFDSDFTERTTKTNAFRTGLSSSVIGYFNAGHRGASAGMGFPVFSG